jgi:hypothetical protein
MTTYTTNELATRVLKDLGLVAAEETPSAADLAWAVETVESEVTMLAAKGIPIWNGSEIDVPQEYLTALSRRIGLAVGPSFGMFSIADAEQMMPAAEANLRRLGATQPTGVVMQAEYF